MENASLFYGLLEYFTVIWYSIWPFGNVVVTWHIFPRFGILCQEESGNPVVDAISVVDRIARWHIFKPKIEIWVNLCGCCY
jgi:hypothetical protein